MVGGRWVGMKGGGCGGKEDWDEDEGCGLCMKWQQQARRAYDPCPSPPCLGLQTLRLGAPV